MEVGGANGLFWRVLLFRLSDWWDFFHSIFSPVKHDYLINMMNECRLMDSTESNTTI